MMKTNKILLLVFAIGLVIFSCKKDKETPVNPFDNVDYSSDSTHVDTLDQYSLASIHQEIFHAKCAVPGCHDGAFEPDFRTPNSSYSTLVYHPIIKNNKDSSFKYRVVPYSSAASVLYERISNCCFVNTNDRMPQSSIGEPLPAQDIERIKKWIDDGAKGLQGESSDAPDSEPSFQYVYALIDSGFPLKYDTKELSADGNRKNNIFYGEMILDTNMQVVLVSTVTDDNTAIKDMTNARLVLSYDKNDFTSPIATVTSLFLNVNGGLWYSSFSTANITENTTVYMRYYINDGKHPSDTEFPESVTPDYFKTHWSFVVEAGSNN